MNSSLGANDWGFSEAVTPSSIQNNANGAGREKENYSRGESPAVNLAAVCVGVGDKEQAFSWLEKDFQARTGLLLFITILPDYDTLRGDARYTDLLRRIGLRQ